MSFFICLGSHEKKTQNQLNKFTTLLFKIVNNFHKNSKRQLSHTPSFFKQLFLLKIKNNNQLLLNAQIQITIYIQATFIFFYPFTLYLNRISRCIDSYGCWRVLECLVWLAVISHGRKRRLIYNLLFRFGLNLLESKQSLYVIGRFFFLYYHKYICRKFIIEGLYTSN